METVYYLGNREGDISSAAAFSEFANSVSIDESADVLYMLPDNYQSIKNPSRYPAPIRNVAVIEKLGFTATGRERNGDKGFYELTRSSDQFKPPVYVLSASAFAYDCIAARVGHSQHEFFD